MEEHDREKWLNRISILLDKAESTDSEHEAQACRDKASELLLKFNLKISDIERDDGNPNIVANITNKWEDSPYEIKEWRTTTSFAVAHLCLCKRYLMGKLLVLFVGTKDNTDTAIRMFHQVNNEILSYMKADLQIAKKEGIFKQGINPTNWRQIYLESAAGAVKRKALQIMSRRSIQGMDGISASSVTTLVVQHESLIEEYMQSQFKKIKKYKSNGYTQYIHDAATKGYSAGSKIELEYKLEGSNETS